MLWVRPHVRLNSRGFFGLEFSMEIPASSQRPCSVPRYKQSQNYTSKETVATQHSLRLSSQPGIQISKYGSSAVQFQVRGCPSSLAGRRGSATGGTLTRKLNSPRSSRRSTLPECYDAIFNWRSGPLPTSRANAIFVMDCWKFPPAKHVGSGPNP
jgi:hypothetical protein